MTKSFHEKFNRKITNSNTRGEISYGKMQYAIYIVFFPIRLQWIWNVCKYYPLTREQNSQTFRIYANVFPRSFPRTSSPKQCAANNTFKTLLCKVQMHFNLFLAICSFSCLIFTVFCQNHGFLSLSSIPSPHLDFILRVPYFLNF